MNERPRHSNARLIANLEALHKNDDRAALAILRRSIGKPPGASPEVFRLIGQYLPESRLGEENCFLVAALFAKHPLSWHRREDEPRSRHNFGASMYKLKLKRGEKSEGIQRRFSALLVASREELGNHLRHAISLLAADEIEVDWLQLLDDLELWHLDDRLAQRRWARAFWTSSEAPMNATIEDTQPESQEGDN